MTIKLKAETQARFIVSIRRYFAENLDDDIGDLKASLFLEFCVREIGPSIYNQAIADAQRFIQEKAADLGGNRYEAEFDYWKK